MMEWQLQLCDTRASEPNIMLGSFPDVCSELMNTGEPGTEAACTDVGILVDSINAETEYDLSRAIC